MKCPMIPGFKGRANCLKEECAWWLVNEDNGDRKWEGCAIVYLVWALFDIKDKMPSKPV